MKYYYIICETCFCGERGDYVYATDNEEDLLKYAASCADATGEEWFDAATLEEEEMEEDEYWSSLSYNIGEITKEEYEMYTKQLGLGA